LSNLDYNTVSRAQCIERCTLRSYGGFVSNHNFYPGGVWHGFMPIVVEAVSANDFLVWIDSASS